MKYLVCAALTAIVAPLANAEIVDSVRLGVMAHNIKVTDDKNADKEDGVNINGEIRFNGIEQLSWIGSPHPFVMASVNTASETSFAAAGLEWDFEFADGWHLEPGVSYAMHTGELKIKGDTAAERAAYQEEFLLLGSRDLFRTSLALTRDFNEKWSAQLLFEHLSHGQILGNGRNQGLDEFGIRLVRRY